jgi:pilus assembly protein CpaB
MNHVRNWRVLTAAVAAVAALLAAVGVYFYLNKADQRAEDKVAQVSVLVASQPIPAGTSGSTAEQKGWLSLKKVARKDVPPGTLTSTAGLQTLVAAYPIDNGGYISPSTFVNSASVGDFAGTLTAGQQAVSISVDQQHGVAGLIQPGDLVGVVISLRVTDPAKASDAGHMTTAYLLPSLKVLAVGTTTEVTPQPAAAVPTASGSTTPTTQPASAAVQNKGLITVAVNPRQAEQIAQAYALNSLVYVTLDPTHFDAKKFSFPAEIVDSSNLFDQKLNVWRQVEDQAAAGK